VGPLAVLPIAGPGRLRAKSTPTEPWPQSVRPPAPLAAQGGQGSERALWISLNYDSVVNKYNGMSCEPFPPERWRNRAAEARRRAEELRDENARRVMLEIAAAYVRLAEMTAAANELAPSLRSN
jgi:hypothetical protein